VSGRFEPPMQPIRPNHRAGAPGGIGWRLLGRLLGVWLLMLATAIANGGLREWLLAPRLAPLAAHQLSSLLLCGAILCISGWFVRGQGITGRGRLLAIGLSWALLTLGFEFGLFYLLLGKPLALLLADYDLAQGRLFGLVIATTALAPLLLGRRGGGDRSPRD